MQFNVAQLLREHTGTVRRFELDEDISHFSSEELLLVTPLTGHVTLMRDTDGILVTGALHTEATVPCARCLEPVTVPVDTELEEQFYPTVEVDTGRRVTAPQDADPDTLIDNKHILDATELIRQSIVLAVPIAPVHPDGCPPDAIVPVSDADAQEQTATDPRWAALEKFKNDRDGA